LIGGRRLIQTPDNGIFDCQQRHYRQKRSSVNIATHCATSIYAIRREFRELAIDSGVIFGTIQCMDKHICFLLIPMRYGRSGKPLSPEDFIAIQKALNRQFGGHTPIGPTQSPEGVEPGGQWVDPETGETVTDLSWMVKVAVDPESLDVFRRVVRIIGLALEQKEMYFEIGPPTGEILKVVGGDYDEVEREVMDDLTELFTEEDEGSDEEKKSNA
jgi:hypothetical protein